MLWRSWSYINLDFAAQYLNILYMKSHYFLQVSWIWILLFSWNYVNWKTTLQKLWFKKKNLVSHLHSCFRSLLLAQSENVIGQTATVMWTQTHFFFFYWSDQVRLPWLQRLDRCELTNLINVSPKQIMESVPRYSKMCHVPPCSTTPVKIHLNI